MRYFTRIIFIIFSLSAVYSSSENHELFEVTAIEDLMREHGLLNRVLLIYEQIILSLEKNKLTVVPILSQAADIIKDFIEDYHEQDEEQHIFPIFKKRATYTRLVNTLIAQHKAGRKITAEIKKIVVNNQIGKQQTKKLIQLLRKFIRMYRVHEAREDTVLFPKLHTLISQKEYENLNKILESNEQKKFGEGGFEKMVKKVTKLEQELGIYNLEQFTPQ